MIRTEIVADVRCATGENPLWHPDEERVYWTDIPAGRLYRYDPRTGAHEICYEDRPVGGFTIQADGNLLLFRDHGNVVLFSGGRIGATVSDSIPEMRSTRFNDIIADPHGRVFAGSMSREGRADGMLWRFDRDGSRQLLGAGYLTPNGMGFSPDRRYFYFTDSRARRIYRFDFDDSTGMPGRRDIFTETTPEEAATIGRSDGMTVDAGGCVWSARWDGARILRYAHDGNIDLQIPMPAHRISSLTFGGGDFTDLYVTSAAGGTPVRNDRYAGALFRVRGAGRGLPEYRSKIGQLNNISIG